MLLEKKIAVISGGGQGIGFSIAKNMIDEGAFVVIGQRGREKGKAAAEKLGDHCRYYPLDAAQESQWEGIFRHTVDTFGRVDILVNCAGITGGSADVEHETLDDWTKVMDINATGVFLGVKYAMEYMKNGGSIVNINSMAGVYAEPVAVAYSASKGAARMITKHAALYGAKKNPVIRVNSIHPGSTNTPMVAEITQLQPEVMEAQKKKIPLGKFAEPEDIAHMAAFLASDQSAYITGGEFFVDGGISAGF